MIDVRDFNDPIRLRLLRVHQVGLSDEARTNSSCGSSAIRFWTWCSSVIGTAWRDLSTIHLNADCGISL